MNEQTVEALSRRAASISRRGSLLTLGGALAAGAVPSLAEAKKGKKAKKKAKQKAAERAENEADLICQNQVTKCRTHIASICPGGDQCLAAIECCSSFGTCNFTGFLDCVIALSS